MSQDSKDEFESAEADSHDNQIPDSDRGDTAVEQSPAPVGGDPPSAGSEDVHLPEQFFRELFANYTDASDPDIETGREAFLEWVSDELGVDPESVAMQGRGTDDTPSTFVLFCGGGGAVRSGTNDVVELHNGGLMETNRRARSFQFGYPGKFNHLQFEFLDSENIRSDVEQAAPQDAPTFKRTLLDSYRPFAEGGAGRSPYQMSLWVLNNEQGLLEKTLDLLNNEGFSIEMVQGFLGGGTGSGLILTVSELARQDLVGTGPGMLGAAISTGEFLLENDSVNTVAGMPDRQTVHDEVDIIRRLGEDVASGDFDFVSYATNWSLALHGFFDYENHTLEDIKNFYGPLRERRSLVEIGHDYRFDAQLAPYLNHGVMNEAWSQTQFPFLLMSYRPVDVEFRRGRARWDIADMKGAIEGHFWSKGFAGVDEPKTLGDRVRECQKAEHEIQQLDAATRLAANKLASDVTFDDIEKAIPIVFAPEMDIGRSELRVIEDAVEQEYNFDNTQSVRARELADIGQEKVPGSPELAVWVLAAHQAPMASKLAMYEEDFVKVMPNNGGA